MSTQGVTSKQLTAKISDNRMYAAIIVKSPEELDSVTPEEVIAILNETGIAINDDVRNRINHFVEQAHNNELTNQPVIIAEGRPVQEPRSEEFVWADEYKQNSAEWTDDSPVDFYSFNSIITVQEGSTIGTISPIQPGHDGVNVLGEKIPTSVEPIQLETDETVQKSTDVPPVITANVSGKVCLTDGKLSIQEVLDIQGDVDFGTGHIDSPTHVFIHGTVQDKFSVRSDKSITVCGAIQAANVHSEEDVVVRGGILARHSGRVSAKGEITAKFCDEAHLTAQKDLRIARELMNCQVHTEGSLITVSGAIIGGVVYARQGGSVATIGSDAHVPTRVCIGPHPTELREVAEIEQRNKSAREAVERIRETVRPLLANQKRLTNAQKEQATELLFKADETEMQIAESEKRKEELLGMQEGAAPVKLTVTNTAYAGTTINIGRRLTTLHKELRGPCTIELRKIDKVTEIVAVNSLSASVTVLPNAIAPIDELMEGFEEENEPDTQAAESHS